MEAGIRARLTRAALLLAMGFVYFGVITPLGLLRRAFGGNRLVHRAGGGGFWKTRREGERRSRLERQW